MRISTEQQKVDKKRFDEGWERIFGNKKKKKPQKKGGKKPCGKE